MPSTSGRHRRRRRSRRRVRCWQGRRGREGPKAFWLFLFTPWRGGIGNTIIGFQAKGACCGARRVISRSVDLDKAFGTDRLVATPGEVDIWRIILKEWRLVLSSGSRPFFWTHQEADRTFYSVVVQHGLLHLHFLSMTWFLFNGPLHFVTTVRSTARSGLLGYAGCWSSRKRHWRLRFWQKGGCCYLFRGIRQTLNERKNNVWEAYTPYLLFLFGVTLVKGW